MKGLLSKAALLGTLSILALSAANAQSRRASNPGYGHQQQGQRVVHRVQRNMYDRDRISLAQAFSRQLGPNAMISSVTIVAQAQGYNSKAVLKANGQRLAVTQLNYRGAKLLRLHGPTPLRGLNLIIKGGAYVQRISATVVPARARGQVLKARVGIQTTRQGTILPIKRLVREATGVALGGKNIQKVIFKAQALIGRRGYANATAQVLVNGYPTGQVIYLTPQMTRHAIALYGNNQGSIKLQVQGRALIQMVGLKVQGHGGYGRY